jgi:hypothetical protein
MSGESFHYHKTDSLQAFIASVGKKTAFSFAAERAAGVLNVIKR